jgi:hypothetical protein
MVASKGRMQRTYRLTHVQTRERTMETRQRGAGEEAPFTERGQEV